MRRSLASCLLLLLTADSVGAQVQVDVRLEKTRYLAGEPVVVIVDVLNVGDEAVGYSAGYGNVRLTVAGVQRRLTRDASGCFVSVSSFSPGSGGVDHPPILPPGQTTTFRYLLRDYDLTPGQYEVTAAGRAEVRWKYNPIPRAANVPPPPPPRHKETDPVPGAEFERTLPLTVGAATEDDLKAVLAPLLAAADGSDVIQRYEARAAITESAPPFLVSEVARFAAEDQYNFPAIAALGRMGTAGSRAHLKNLFRTAQGRRADQIVMALAHIGHRDDAAFFAAVLQDETVDERSRRYAAFGLGLIGGDRAVQSLADALPSAPAEVRASIATALGNTGSRAAVPIVIGMYGNDDVRNAICGALRTLTQTSWCGGAWVDPAAMRRQWLRRWEEDDSQRPVFRPTCTSQPIPGEPTSVAARATPPAATPVPARPTPPAAGPPRVSSPNPGLAAPNSVMQVHGYDLGLEDRGTVRVRLTQGIVERGAEFGNIGWSENEGGPGRRYYHMDVRMPADLAPGRWLLVVDVKGVASDPIPVEIVPARPFVLSRIVPAHPHPAQLVAVETGHLGQVVDYVQLMDARGTQWRIPVSAYPGSVRFRLPDEVADGDATVRAARKENGVERFSDPLRFLITSEPLPLPGFAMAGMPAVAPGQWTDLTRNAETEFEITRADRIEVEFRQGDVAAISRAVAPNKIHIQVPIQMKPGEARVRTRTWIDDVPSDWSRLVASFQVLVVTSLQRLRRSWGIHPGRWSGIQANRPRSSRRERERACCCVAIFP